MLRWGSQVEEALPGRGVERGRGLGDGVQADPHRAGPAPLTWLLEMLWFVSLHEWI